MTTSPTVPLKTPRGAWLIFTIALLGYSITIVQRTTIGVVGLDAIERFSAGAGIVSLFAVVQMLVYALAQVPSGFASDRFGSRVVLTAGALLMAGGQAVLAFADQVPIAVLGRVLVALGDACTWTPIIRLLPNWFPNRRVPILTQLCAMTGSFGQVISAVPFVALLRLEGWTPAFLSAAGLGLLMAATYALTLRNHPAGITPGARLVGEPALKQVAAVLKRPGTRLAYWGHWLASSWNLTFLMMWGFPYLEQAQGLGAGEIGTLFTIRWVASVSSGLTLGYLTSRHPLRRTTLILLANAAAALPWLVVLALPDPAPLWLLIVLIIGVGAADPGSGVGFDIARTSNPTSHTGTATGIVVMGGFTSSLLNIAAIGVTLDLLGGDYSFTDFRIAMATQFVPFAIGLVVFLRVRRKARQLDAEENGTIFLTWPQVFDREWQRHKDRRGRRG